MSIVLRYVLAVCALLALMVYAQEAQASYLRKYVTPSNDWYILTGDRCVTADGKAYDRRIYSLVVIHYRHSDKSTGCWQLAPGEPDKVVIFDHYSPFVKQVPIKALVRHPD